MTKNAFRETCIRHMKDQQDYAKMYRDGKVRRTLRKILIKIKPKKILFYWPMKHEVDIRKNLFEFRKSAAIYLPFMDDISFKMVPFRYPLERKCFGIYEPRDSRKKINLIDVAIVPVVGVDGSLGRIGFGKGMYDRFFPTLKKKPITIFVQSYECITHKFLCDHYDITADIVITPNRIYGLKDFHVKRTTRRGSSSCRKWSSRIFNFKKSYRRPF